MKTENQPRLLRMRNLTAYLALSRAHIYQKINEGTFPPGQMISQGIRVWEKSAIDQWIEKRLRMGKDS